ncbi:MAG: hypothetical protein ABWJ42_03290 [Sulfolobales archaeon]
MTSLFTTRYLFSLSIIFLLDLAVSYAIGFFALWSYHRITDVLGYRVGYIALLAGVSSLILLLSDLFLYLFVFRVFLLKKTFSPGFIRRSLILFLAGSTPIFILTTPDIIAGIGGVVAEDLFYGFVAFSVLVWSAFLALYSVYIHPVYAPYAGIIINICAYSGDKSLKCFWHSLSRHRSLLLFIVIVSILVLVIVSLATRLLVLAVPSLGDMIIPIQAPRVESGWLSKWYNVISSLVPRYYNLVLSPLSYILYTYLLSAIGRKSLERIRSSLLAER